MAAEFSGTDVTFTVRSVVHHETGTILKLSFKKASKEDRGWLNGFMTKLGFFGFSVSPPAYEEDQLVEYHDLSLSGYQYIEPGDEVRMVISKVV